MDGPVVVAGATGYLGGHVVRALLARGHRVRALVRGDASRLGELLSLGAEPFVGEATRPETLAGLCDGAAAVFSSLGKHDLERRPTTREVDLLANQAVLAEAIRAQVGHFVFVSVIHGPRLRDEGNAGAACREQVVDDLVASGLPWTVLRPTGFFNDMGDFFKMAAAGTGWLVGDGSVQMNPIHGADLAAEAVRCLEDPAERGQAHDVGGPDVLSWRRIQEMAFEALGRPPRLRRAPAWLLGAGSAVVRPFNPMVGDLLHAVRRLSAWGAVGRPVGTHHLADFFAELAAAERQKG